MNKITLKNFFAVLLACLLIIAMVIIQGATAEENGIIFWLGLIIVCCAVIFILYKTVQISQKLSDSNAELNAVKDKLSKLLPPKEENKEANNNSVE